MTNPSSASYASRVELAKTLGKVRPDKGRYMIDIWADGQRYKLRHTPVVGGGWLPFRDEESAREVLRMIRATIATASASRSKCSMTRLLRWISRCLGVIQISLAFLYPEDDKLVRLDLKFRTWK